MSASDTFEQLLAVATRALKAEGFSKRGSTFFSRQDGNWQVIDFQKSQKSTAEEVLFTVNVGMASARLLDFFSRSRDATRPPQVAEWHWRRRLDAIAPDGADQWWSVRSNTQVERIADGILDQLRAVALPEMRKLVRDEALRDLWLTGQSPALTDLQRLQNLAVLLSVLGPSEARMRTMEDLRRLSNAAARFIEQKLGSGAGQQSAEPAPLSGVWISDPDDVEGAREFGRTTVDFRSNGELTYTIHQPDKDQKMFLTFRVEPGLLVTNQASAPREEKTAYSFTPDGKLILSFGGRRSVYVRQPE